MMASSANQEAPFASAHHTGADLQGLCWRSIIAGAIIAASVLLLLLSFGSSIGLAVASPSATWRDTSSVLSLLGGLWLLLTSLVSFSLGGYLAGAFRPTASAAKPHEAEFRDGSHGLAVWALAVLIGAALTFSLARDSGTRSDGALPSATNAQSFLAFELDRLLRSDQKPGATNADSELRAQAARIIFSSLGRTGITPDDRNYLVRAVMTRTGLAQPEAEARVDKAFTDSKAAVSRARRGAVILAFMTAASLLIGAVVAWLAAASGGKHHDDAIIPAFWHRWEVDRLFFIR
jgi:hypothetical protein